jgi:hypothetical protein
MATYDRPNDVQFTSANPDLGAGGLNSTLGTERRGMSPSLSEQTPGLDKTSRVRSLAMRPVSYARERPAVVASIVGGLVVLGIGTWLAMRSRRPTRWQLLRDYGIDLGTTARDRGVDLFDWLRSKL